MNTMHNNEDEEEKNSYLLIILYIAKNLNDFDVFFIFPYTTGIILSLEMTFHTIFNFQPIMNRLMFHKKKETM